MRLRAFLVVLMLWGACGAAQAADGDKLLVQKLANCSGLMSLISANAKARGQDEMADKSYASSTQFAIAARYYADGVPAKAVNEAIAIARTKTEYLYKEGGDNALNDDIHSCGSPELAEKGQIALDAQEKADQAAADKKGK